MRTQVHHLVREAARTHGDAPALTYNDLTVTYAELWRDVVRFGTALNGMGIRHGERVAVYLNKRIETVTALFGTSAGDGVFVPINPLLRAKQVGYIMRDCGARVLMTSPDRLAQLREELQRCDSVEHVILVGGEPAAEPARRYTVSPWPTATEGAAFTANAIDADMAAIMYTSGSTGSLRELYSAIGTLSLVRKASVTTLAILLTT